MARELKPGDSVWVPCARISDLVDRSVALYQSSVVEVRDRSVRVELPDALSSDWLGASLVHKDVGFLILNIGDLASEDSLLNPLAKSVTQFCRLLVPDDQVRSVQIRSLDEL